MLEQRNIIADKSDLSELITDFPSESGAYDVSEALDLLFTRYKSLGVSRYAGIINLIKEEQLPVFFNELILSIHGFLFLNILSNAGFFRRSSEPNNGAVYFGPNGRFSGYPPAILAEEVQSACNHLIKSTADPKKNAILFYQHFVCVHPFYDANGRIGRFIVNVYLDLHGYRMSWRKLRKNDKWLKKLNECHKRIGMNSFDIYFAYLFNYFDPFITKQEDLNH